MSLQVPQLPLPGGQSIPQLGFGTLHLQPDRSDTSENARITSEIVHHALQVGYRHLDTAQMYGNERGVGDGLRASSLAREEVFLTSKLGNGNHAPADVQRSFAETLEKLGVEQLDLFLIHWPLPTLYGGDYLSTWKAVLDLKEGGALRSAGVSNFQPDHLDQLIEATGHAPAVNQVEIHPYFANRDTVEACWRHGIQVEAWSPLGQGKVLADPVIERLARHYKREPAQIVLRWHLQQGRVVIPKSVHPERMQMNLQTLEFELTPEDLKAIDSLDRGESGRIGPNPDTFAWLP